MKRNNQWDVHKHREELMVSDMATIYHHDKGVLCQLEKHIYVLIYHPIQFKSRDEAFKWIKDGCIADLQESLCNLSVGFSKNLLEVLDT